MREINRIIQLIVLNVVFSQYCQQREKTFTPWVFSACGFRSAVFFAHATCDKNVSFDYHMIAISYII